MKSKPVFIITASVTLLAAGLSTSASALLDDAPVVYITPTGISACVYQEIRARIGPDNTVTYKIYGLCQGAAISGELTFQSGEFYESFTVSNREKIETHGYCATDPWATAIDCHDQTVSAVGLKVDPEVNGQAPISLVPAGSASAFHEAFNNASRPNPPGVPVNFSATADFGQMTARWIAPDDSGDRPYLGFLVQVQPHGAAGATWTDFGRIKWHARPEYILPGKLPPLSSTVKAWDARVCATTQLAQTCTPALLPTSGAVHEATEVKKAHSAATEVMQAPASNALGRVAPAPVPVTPAELDALAARGVEVAQHDPGVAKRRIGGYDGEQRGFDIGTALFGNPAFGGEGNTLMGPGSMRIRNSLNPAEQRGFDRSVQFNAPRR